MTASVQVPPPPAQSLKTSVAGQPRASPVQVPAYLHNAARPGARPNTKVPTLSWLLGLAVLVTRRSRST